MGFRSTSRLRGQQAVEENRKKAAILEETNQKLLRIEQDERVSISEAANNEAEAERGRILAEINGEVLKMKEKYQKEYEIARDERLKEAAERRLAIQEVEAQKEEKEREQRQKDVDLENEREAHLSKIRREEVANLIEGLRSIPPVDYAGVQTLVMGNSGSQDQVSGVLMSLVSNLVGGTSRGPDTSD